MQQLRSVSYVSMLLAVLLATGCGDASTVHSEENPKKHSEQSSEDAPEMIERKRPTLGPPPPQPQIDLSVPIEEFVVMVERMGKYDDAEWHYGGEFPQSSPEEYGFTHIGFYLTWATERQLLSEWFVEETGEEEIAAVARREKSPIHLLQIWDGALVDDMLSDDGNAFSKTVYSTNEPVYLLDYVNTIEQHGMSLYQVAPTWENYELIKPVLDRRYDEWRARQ